MPLGKLRVPALPVPAFPAKSEMGLHDPPIDNVTVCVISVVYFHSLDVQIHNFRLRRCKHIRFLNIL